MKERFETFTVLIAKIGRNIRKIKNQEMSEYDLRSTHVSCLYYLYAHDSLTATELSERCEEDKATISRVIDYLVISGFIDYPEKDGKRYKTPLTLTEKGREAGKKIFDKVKRVLDEVGNGLTEEERIFFYKTLAKISENLECVAKNEFNKKPR